jgi:hypothetical protein
VVIFQQKEEHIGQHNDQHKLHLPTTLHQHCHTFEPVGSHENRQVKIHISLRNKQKTN